MTRLIKDKTSQLLLGLFLGIIFGGIMKLFPPGFYIDDIIVNGLLRLLGTGFIELIKMTVMPLIFVSLVCGISSFSDSKKLGTVGIKTLLMFFITTVVSIIIAIILSFIFKPGVGLNISYLSSVGGYVPKEAKSIIDILIDIIPSNPIKAMSKGNLLQVLVFAAFFGVSLGSMGSRAESIIKVFNVVNECMMKIVFMIMSIAPIGVFALIANTIYSIGFESLLGILKMSGVVLLSLVLQAFIVYGVTYKYFTRLSFRKFLSKYTKVAGVAFSTSSSNSALPFSMQMMEEMGVKKSIYQFVLPIGATINMAGTAIMQGVSTVFIAQAYNLSLPFQSILTITITAVFASVGAAGVPGVGMIMMAMVLESVGLPVEGIALIIGFDRVLDMFRTIVNVMGDCICSVVVAYSEKDMDMEKYNFNV